ncbi:MAG: hypothetical protein R2845_01215 [Thermomicrobiales bacterium]
MTARQHTGICHGVRQHGIDRRNQMDGEIGASGDLRICDQSVEQLHFSRDRGQRSLLRRCELIEGEELGSPANRSRGLSSS